MSELQRPPREVDALVVGGGFYGASIASFLARRFRSVMLMERTRALLSRASYSNQARVHGGYHYPRSVLTSLRSRKNYARFLSEFPGAISQSFTALYAIARNNSKVTAGQFAEFCHRIGAPLKAAARPLASKFNADMIEAVFEVEESAFNARDLAANVLRMSVEARVHLALGLTARNVRPGGRRRLTVKWGEMPDQETSADWVFSCTYSALNDLLADSGLPLVPLVHELTEIALVEVPPSLMGLGVTVMDGPFWSTMPFPAEAVHSLSHVRYTPHSRWNDGGVDGHTFRGDEVRIRSRTSRVAHMQRDAARYLPEMAKARYVKSLWEIKTILPRSDMDDSRPILARPVDGAPGLFAILGAKIDNIFDIEDVLGGMFDHLGEG